MKNAHSDCSYSDYRIAHKRWILDKYSAVQNLFSWEFGLHPINFMLSAQSVKRCECIQKETMCASFSWSMWKEDAMALKEIPDRALICSCGLGPPLPQRHKKEGGGSVLMGCLVVLGYFGLCHVGQQ